MAFRSLINELHARLAKQGIRDLRPAYGFVLLAAQHAPIGVNAVGELLGVTKQAASKLVDSMEASGYVRRAADSADARTRRMELTNAGHRVLEAVEEIYAELEAEWGAIVGVRAVETLRNDLITILRAQNAGALPPVRPTW